MFSRPLHDNGKVFSRTTASISQFGAPITVAPNECCVILSQGQVLATLPGGNHTLSIQEIPALSGIAGDLDLVFVIQAPVMGQRFSGVAPDFRDPATGQSIEAKVTGEYMVQPTNAGLLAQSAVASGSTAEAFGTYVQDSILRAFSTAMTGLLRSGQAQVSTLGGMLITTVPEVARLASESLANVGAQILAIQNPVVQLGNGQGGFAAAQAGMQMPPNPMQATEAAFSRVIEENNPLNKEYSLRVDSGLLGVNIDKGGIKLDEEKLEKGVKKKVKGAIENVVITAIFAVVFIAIVAGVGIFIWWKVRSDSSAAASPPDAASATEVKWDGKTTYTCTGGNNLIKGAKAKLTAGSAIKAMGNCKLTLQSVEISAPTAIEALGNAEVVVTGGYIEGTTHSVSAMGNVKVNITGATVKGKKNVMAPAVVTGVP
ncbi:MAG: hypothetical protein U0165_04430 [Polyangiaceae bacterium]